MKNFLEDVVDICFALAAVLTYVMFLALMVFIIHELYKAW